MLNIKATDKALEVYNEMKLGKKIAYLIFKIADGKTDKEDDKVLKDCIFVETKVTKADAGDDYLDSYISAVKSSGEPRYSVVDYNHKLLFVTWNPDSASGKLKMKYATVNEGFIQELVGIQIKIQATDDGELSQEVIKEKTKSSV